MTASERATKCKYGECGSCGVVIHPWCFEPMDPVELLSAQAHTAREALRVLLKGVVIMEDSHGVGAYLVPAERLDELCEVMGVEP